VIKEDAKQRTYIKKTMCQPDRPGLSIESTLCRCPRIQLIKKLCFYVYTEHHDVQDRQRWLKLSHYFQDMDCNH
jgi:hypothetical protein